MDSRDKQELFQYYDERAPEYEAFYDGRFPTVIPDPERYRNDRDAVFRILPSHLSGHCLDIACGTGFWLPEYHQNCPHTTLIDQSEGVLKECQEKIDRLGINGKTTVIRADIFDYPYPVNTYDCVHMGFLISHLTDDELSDLLEILKPAMVPRGTITLVDSTWNADIEAMGRRKSGMITRELMNGKKFQIYKYFFTQGDLHSMATANGLSISIEYWGKVFFFATCRFME